MTPLEQGRLVNLLVQQVNYDGAAAIKPSAGIDVLDSQAIERYRDEYEDSESVP